ncbi:hypothetical protein L2E82_52696 [Cichorium intybus]|nr:hypothetical protein L2E82_52696 [Cichorium intybus]
MPALTGMNVLKKPQLSYVIEKEDFCVFALLLRKHSFLVSFLKILQLVHARNRPIQQLFVPFPRGVKFSSVRVNGMAPWPLISI